MKARFLVTAAVLPAMLVPATVLAGCSSGPAPKTVMTKPAMSSIAMATSSADATGAMPMKKTMPETVVSERTVANNGVQTIAIDLANETYSPNLVTAKVGVPIDITFGRGEKCVKMLVFPSFGIKADMTKGPRTFHLPALTAGSYKWRCGMGMRHGELRVE